LKELVIRTGTNKLVNNIVDLDRVRSLLDRISTRRRFLARRQKAREASGSAATEHGVYIHTHISVYNFLNWVLTIDVPEIVVVEDIPSTPPPPMSSRDITSAIRRHSASMTMTSWTEHETPTRRDGQFELSDLTPTIGGGGGSSSSRGLRRDRRLSDMSAVSADLGLRHTYVFGLRFVDRVDNNLY
jgi:hypothetical protein